LFQNCTALTGQSLRVILEGLVNLRSLTIISCSKVFDYSSLSQCRVLDSLNIGHSPHLSDEELIPLASHKMLRSLTLNKCFNITNSSILIVIRDCTLNNISLISCDGITDEVLYSLASIHYAIETISVQGCACITSKGVAALALMKNITKLRELDISHNRNIDDMAILSIHNGLKLKKRESGENRADGNKENEIQPQTSNDLVTS
uniref:Leucine Rich repeat-containing domain protein n=1 Tax=Onchocerca flexuosa TaxID=387005 RepID=A0A183I0A0_9BILA